MRLPLRAISLLALPALTTLAISLACGGSSSTTSSGTTPAPATGTTAVILTDAPSDQWSAVEVVVTQVAFLNKGDHSKEVVAFQGATAKINLVDLDSVGELLATAKIPVGTYDALRITIDPTSVTLVDLNGNTIPSAQVHVQGASVLVNLSADLVVTESGSNAVQLDFDLGHPLFLVQLPNGDWALTLQVNHRPNANGMAGLAKMAFRYRRGTIASVGASSFVLHTDSGNDLTVNVGTGAWFFDTDAKVQGSFGGLAVGKNALVSLRLQADGTVWAVRVWYGANALPTWTPEGHVFRVDTGMNRLMVSASNGAPRPIVIDPTTAFTFQGSQSLGTGPSALAHIWAGFKVQVAVADPLASPLHATAVDVQRAVDGGVIKTATATDFTYQFCRGGDRVHAYASPFSWWYLGFPGSPSSSTADFAAAVTGAGDLRVQGVSDLVWNAGTSAWDASTAIFLPVNLPKGTISTSYNAGALGFSFTDSTGSAKTITATLNTTAGAQPSVIEVNRQNGLVTSTAVPESAWATKLVTPTVARVAVVPKPDGSFAAYAVVIFTGF
jgi:hypothetical protein